MSNGTADKSGGLTSENSERDSGSNNPLRFRRTVIPILLTLAAILIGWGILLITSGQNNALADLFPNWTPLALFGFALVFLALGLLNMLSIRNKRGGIPR
jgi:hypothetical protein